MPVVSCNLFFDQAAEDAVRGLWQGLTAEGLPAKSVAGYAPHITVTAYTTDIPQATAAEFTARLRDVAAAQQPIPIRLESLGVFPGAGVVFLAPRVSRALLDVHRAVFERLAGPGMPALLEDLLLPDRWTPHVTLATHLNGEQTAQIVRACMREWRPLQGKALGLGMRIHPNLADAHQLAFGG